MQRHTVAKVALLDDARRQTTRATASLMANTRRGRLACSAQEVCASGTKSVHAPGAGLGAGAGLLGEAPDTGLNAEAGLAAGVTEGLAAGVGLLEGVVPGGQRLHVAAQYPPSGPPATNMKGSPHLPKSRCCWQLCWLSGGTSLQVGAGVDVMVATGAGEGPLGEGPVVAAGDGVSVGLKPGEVAAGVVTGVATGEATGEATGVEAGVGLVAGEAEGLVAGEGEGLGLAAGEWLELGLRLGLGLGLGLGLVPWGQRLQVAAQ